MSKEESNKSPLISTPVVLSVAVLALAVSYYSGFLVVLPVLVVALFFAGIFTHGASNKEQDSGVTNVIQSNVRQQNDIKASEKVDDSLNAQDSSTKKVQAMAAPPVGSAAILAKIRAQRSQSGTGGSKSEQKPVMIVYASQLGTAQDVAMSIHAQCPQHKIKSQCMSLNELGFDNINKEKTPFIIMVASSTGDGDPPDNSAKVYLAVRKKQEAGVFNGVSFTCLGLGDSNYTKYQHVPRVFRNRFTDLGASNFYQHGEADEVDGLEEIVEKWIDGLWPALEEAMHTQKNGITEQKQPASNPTSKNEGELQGVPPLAPCRVKLIWHGEQDANNIQQQESIQFTDKQISYRDPQGLYGPEEPFVAKIKSSQLMTDSNSDRRVQHLEIDVTGSGLKYVAGDSIGVMPENDPEMVESLIKRLNLNGDSVFSVEPASSEEQLNPGVKLLPHLKWPCTIRSAFSRGCDITGLPRKSFLRFLADHCSSSEEKQKLLLLSSRSGKEVYAKEIMEGQPSLLDLLKIFPSCQPNLEHLLDIIHPLAPRMYSISSSNYELPNEVHIAFSVVKYQTMYGTKKGVATTWLDNYCNEKSNDNIQLGTYVRSGGDFKHPLLLESPIIMVGPGTGVAPFRGFLQQRRALKQEKNNLCGESWLFFGCRQEHEDYLYRSDLEQFLKDGTLDHLVNAFSRAQQQKVYVQHKMMEVGQQLADCIVKKGGYIFVCGDGAKMAKDVHACLETILQQHAGMSAQEAQNSLMQLTRAKRYVRDIWS